MNPRHLRRAALVVAGLVPVVLIVLAASGRMFVLRAAWDIVAGWWSYLGRVVPRLNPDPWVVVTAVVCVVGVVLGTHAFLRWLYAATDPGAGAAEPRRWRWKWTLLLVGLVVLTFAAGIAFTGIVHQTSWLVRSPEPLVERTYSGSARGTSAHNLREIGTAAHRCGEPPQSTFDSAGRPLHSWQTELLPHLDLWALARLVDRGKPWTHPGNAQAMQTELWTFRHPSLPGGPVDGYAVSHYAGNAAVVLGDASRTLDSFPQGRSNTIFAGEVSQNFRAWGDPLNARDVRLGGSGHPHGFGGPNGRPAQFLMLDGSVRTFDPKELAELVGKVPD